MNARAHLKFMLYSTTLYGIGLYVSVIPQEPSTYIGFGVGAIVGATFPDIDHRENQHASIIPVWKLHDIICWIKDRFKKDNKKKSSSMFKHGGIIHTLFFNSLIIIAAHYWQSPALVGLAFGTMTHLFLDDITGNWLPWLFWPIKRKKKKKKH